MYPLLDLYIYLVPCNRCKIMSSRYGLAMGMLVIAVNYYCVCIDGKQRSQTPYKPALVVEKKKSTARCCKRVPISGDIVNQKLASLAVKRRPIVVVVGRCCVFSWVCAASRMPRPWARASGFRRASGGGWFHTTWGKARSRPARARFEPDCHGHKILKQRKRHTTINTVSGKKPSSTIRLAELHVRYPFYRRSLSAPCCLFGRHRHNLCFGVRHGCCPS